MLRRCVHLTARTRRFVRRAQQKTQCGERQSRKEKKYFLRYGHLVLDTFPVDVIRQACASLHGHAILPVDGAYLLRVTLPDAQEYIKLSCVENPDGTFSFT